MRGYLLFLQIKIIRKYLKLKDIYLKEYFLKKNNTFISLNVTLQGRNVDESKIVFTYHNESKIVFTFHF